MLTDKRNPSEEGSGGKEKKKLIIVGIQLTFLIAGVAMLAIREHEAFQDFWIITAVVGLLKIPD